jgi:hypothetical protein
MSKKTYQHLLYTNYNNIAVKIKKFRKNDKTNNKKNKKKS